MKLESKEQPKFHGSWTLHHFRERTLLGEYFFHNSLTEEGHAAMLSYSLAASGITPGNSWYVGLIDTAFFIELDYTDRWSQMRLPSSGFTAGTRWNPQNVDIGRGLLLDPLSFPTPAQSGVIVSAVTTIPILAQNGGFESLQGLFITNSASLGSGNPGILFSTAATSAVFVNSGDFLTAQYTLVTSFRL